MGVSMLAFLKVFSSLTKHKLGLGVVTLFPPLNQLEVPTVYVTILYLTRVRGELGVDRSLCQASGTASAFLLYPCVRARGQLTSQLFL